MKVSDTRLSLRLTSWFFSGREDAQVEPAARLVKSHSSEHLTGDPTCLKKHIAV